MKSRMLLPIIVLIALLLRLYRLDNLPAEMWGDIIEHYKLANQILQGNFFFDYRFGGDGPLFSYITSAMAEIFGLSFYTLKLTTAIIGTVLVVVIYFLAQEFFRKKEISCLTAFLTAISFWSLTFSRQAKPYILVPLFIGLILYFILKKRYFISGIFLGLGTYTQASFWAAMLAFSFNFKRLLVGLSIASLFILQIFHNPDFLFSGNSYIGEKFGVTTTGSFFDYFSRILLNSWKNAPSFLIRGDSSFRHNISGHPHVDILSGILFFMGFFLIVKKSIRERNKSLFLYFILPFFVLQVPSVMDVHNPSSIPSMGRMIGIIPFIFMSIAYAIHTFCEFIKRVLSKKVAGYTYYVLLAFILGYIAIANIYNYFFVYPEGLPNKNVPFGRLIAEEIDKYSDRDKFYLVGCCWGDWGQPEPYGIQFMLKDQRRFNFIEESKLNQGCLQLSDSTKNIVLILPPRREDMLYNFSSCFIPINKHVLTYKNWNIALFIDGKRK